MSLQGDVTHGVQAGSDNFHCELVRLMMKATGGNYDRLAQAFPNTARTYEAWYAGEPIPDLAYEETPAELLAEAEYAVAAYNICRRSGLELNVLQDHLTTVGAIEYGRGA
jgi:hypothetical protein